MKFNCSIENRLFLGQPSCVITIELYKTFATFCFVCTEEHGIFLQYQRYDDYYPKLITQEAMKKIALGKDKRYKVISKELMNFCYLRIFGA